MGAGCGALTGLLRISDDEFERSLQAEIGFQGCVNEVETGTVETRRAMLARREPRDTLGVPPGGGPTSEVEAAPLLAELDRLRDENHRCLGWIQKLEDDNARLQADLASLFERNNAYIRSLEEECWRKDEWIKKIERDNSELSEGSRHLEERNFRQLSELHGRIGEREARCVPDAGAWKRVVRALRSRWAPR